MTTALPPPLTTSAAICRPMPLLPPTTMTLRPVKSCAMLVAGITVLVIVM